MIKKEDKPIVLGVNASASLAFKFRGQTIVIVDKKLPRPQRIARIASLKSQMKEAHNA